MPSPRITAVLAVLFGIAVGLGAFTFEDRTFQMRNIALDAVLDLTRNIAAAQRTGAAPAQLVTPGQGH